MSEEEKKAIELLKEKMTELKQEISGTEDWVNTGYEEEELEFYNTLLNLIEKQQEEIERLKRKESIQVAYDGRRYNTEGIILKNYISKDKIKEKIEMLENELEKNNENIEYTRKLIYTADETIKKEIQDLVELLEE